MFPPPMVERLSKLRSPCDLLRDVTTKTQSGCGIKKISAQPTLAPQTGCEFPSSHHREEGWPSDQENTAQHPLFARTGWCSDRTDKEHHPGGVDKEASRHFLGDTASPPRGDARRGIRFFK